MDPASSVDVSAMNSPTLSIHATQTGIILGTVAYMSPEQAAGKAVDKRSDLWAFGVVLLEMLTGRPVFAGETVSHVVAAVLGAQPDWSALPSDTPVPIRRLLRRCLEKDRRRRLESPADARLEIDDALTAPSAADSTSPRNARRPWMWILAIAGFSAAALSVGMRLSRQPAESLGILAVPHPDAADERAAVVRALSRCAASRLRRLNRERIEAVPAAARSTDVAGACRNRRRDISILVAG